jgi:inner membrane protein
LDDIRGIKEELKLNLNGTVLDLIPGKVPGNIPGNTLVAALNLQNGPAGKFNLDLNFRGSKTLLFRPFGKTTTVRLSAPWSDPGFTGSYLPDSRSVSEKGFSADWKVLYMNRSYPQQWKGEMDGLNSATFGVDLLLPVDAYLKTERSVKYAILCILLTFTAFLLIELIYNKPIHAFHYILVGFALCMFYTLLLSISEYLGFNKAYLVAALATLAMVTLYVRTIFRSNSIGLFIAATLTVLYSFIYILIQSQDYSLLMGSIGLFIALALVMFFSRKANLS